MSNTPTIDRFLKGYRKSVLNSADSALIILLEQNAELVEPLFAQRDPLWLHKAFRQTDVTGAASSDMLIWHLIHVAPMFWDELYSFWKILERREEKSRIRQVEEQRDKLLAAIDLVLNGTVLDEAGNRDDDGMLSHWVSIAHLGQWKSILTEAVKAAGGAA